MPLTAVEHPFAHKRERFCGASLGRIAMVARLVSALLVISQCGPYPASATLVVDDNLEPTSTLRALRTSRAHSAEGDVPSWQADVPPTNNASEQDLRPSVIHRRVIGGFRSQLGADVSAILTSRLTTARKRGANLFQALRTVAGPSPLDACSGPAFVEARAG